LSDPSTWHYSRVTSRSPRYTPTPKCPYLRVTSRSPRYPHLSRTNGVPKTVPIRGRLTSEIWPRHIGSRPCGNFRVVSALSCVRICRIDTSCSRSFTQPPQWHHRVVSGKAPWAHAWRSPLQVVSPTGSLEYTRTHHWLGPTLPSCGYLGSEGM
jgi:hypothetical protein